jgi:hypothetical protein
VETARAALIVDIAEDRAKMKALSQAWIEKKTAKLAAAETQIRRAQVEKARLEEVLTARRKCHAIKCWAYSVNRNNQKPPLLEVSGFDEPAKQSAELGGEEGYCHLAGCWSWVS